MVVVVVYPSGEGGVGAQRWGAELCGCYYRLVTEAKTRRRRAREDVRAESVRSESRKQTRGNALRQQDGGGSCFSGLRAGRMSWWLLKMCGKYRESRAVKSSEKCSPSPWGKKKDEENGNGKAKDGENVWDRKMQVQLKSCRGAKRKEKVNNSSEDDVTEIYKSEVQTFSLDTLLKTIIWILIESERSAFRISSELTGLLQRASWGEEKGVEGFSRQICVGNHVGEWKLKEMYMCYLAVISCYLNVHLTNLQTNVSLA